MSAELEHIWTLVQAELALTVGEPTYHIWLEPLRPVELSENRLFLEAPAQACQWIGARFGRVLQASVALVLGAETVVELVPGPPRAADSAGDPADSARPRQPRHMSATSPSGIRDRTPSPDPLQQAGPLGNPKLTFDQFVIGDCNRLAHAAALTVAEMPAQAYNPLFIYGPPGVGKTHLLSSIASLLLSHNPGLSVRCTTGEAFTNAFLGALSAGHTDGFKSCFRDVDVLLMDDVQFLEHKTKTEEEFFHTFNALHDGGRQIVMTSDRPPHDLQALEDRLRERFEAGLVADIKPPDMLTRLAILRMRAHHDHIPVGDEHALTVIAERVENNVRALEGALIRVVAYSSLTGRSITGELADEVLNSLYPRTGTEGRTRRSIVEIQAAAYAHFDVSADELISPTRARRVAWPRQVAMYLARELSGESLPAIGRQFGGRDHTTVLHAWRRASARIAADDASRETVEKLCRTLDFPQ